MNMNVTEVRRRMLSLLESLPKEGIVITKRGLPIAEIRALSDKRKGEYVTGPMIPARGKAGSLSPTTETPYDLIFD